MVFIPVPAIGHIVATETAKLLAERVTFLGLGFYIRALHDEHKLDLVEFKDSNAELIMPCLAKPLLAKILPSVLLDKEWLVVLLGLARRFRETKGIFEGLESYAMNSFRNVNIPSMYPIGPILSLNRDDDHDMESY
ncbi:unnamed protein product [Dovyalis caffra]|uniref:Uncharacterized protein n=1 Tax=Dovyalis caffra TaxID=77055 RepID=A0AAV1S302_9ROSI|nr:unnamed protein product [Dovyalis caffra]